MGTPRNNTMDAAAAKTTLGGLFDRIDQLIKKDGQASKAELEAVFGEHAAEFLKFCDKDADENLSKDEFCDGILKDCDGMSQEDFDENWANRMEGVVAAAEAAKGSESSGLKNKAFLFIKPHAVTDAVKALAKESLSNMGLNILSEGEIKAEDIDSKQLIDNHYYAIASKATILKPDQLNIPEDKFEAKFGLSWADALAGAECSTHSTLVLIWASMPRRWTSSGVSTRKQISSSSSEAVSTVVTSPSRARSLATCSTVSSCRCATSTLPLASQFTPTSLSGTQQACPGKISVPRPWAQLTLLKLPRIRSVA